MMMKVNPTIDFELHYHIFYQLVISPLGFGLGCTLQWMEGDGALSLELDSMICNIRIPISLI